MNSCYINYKKYSVRYCLDDDTFDVMYDGRGRLIEGGHVTEVISDSVKPIVFSEYARPTFSKAYGDRSAEAVITYSGKAVDRADLNLRFVISDAGVTLSVWCESGTDVHLEGSLHFGDHDQKETVCCCIGREGNNFRCGYGPAATALDNALFDRDTDSALILETERSENRISYDWEKDCYRFTMRDGDHYFGDEGHFLRFSVKERIYEEMFDISYRKLEYDTVFKRPPTGWMTWYAVQWSACEEVILRNTALQKELLGDYGADTVWVDAEYRHRDGSGYGIPGYNNYIPNEKYYPHGMKYLSDKIREAGFIPALWIAAEVDTQPNPYTEAHPEIVMSRQFSWSGSYWLDPTNPVVIEEAMKKIIDLAVHEWGYDAIKWDALPEFVWNTDESRDRLYDQSRSTREILLNYFRKAKEYAGEKVPMLSCCGFGERELEIFMQVFNSARIGGDIFFWSDMTALLFHYLYRDYVFHNIVIDNDPDSVVLREKYNTKDQAITRATMVSLLGLPYAIGDDLVTMTPERLDILRRTIPPLPVHPMDIHHKTADRSRMVISAYVETPFMRYCVGGVLNLTGEPKHCTVDLTKDFGLEPDVRYHAYEYWKDSYAGKVSGVTEFDLAPYETRIFSFHAVENRPQIISTSRHIMQGAEDILFLSYDETEKRLCGRSHLIGNTPYRMIIAAPEGYSPVSGDAEKLSDGIYKTEIMKPETGDYDWFIEF